MSFERFNPQNKKLLISSISVMNDRILIAENLIPNSSDFGFTNLYYDAVTKSVGIELAQEGDFKIMWKNKTHSASIFSRTFSAKYDIPKGRYPARFDKNTNMIIVDLLAKK